MTPYTQCPLCFNNATPPYKYCNNCGPVVYSKTIDRELIEQFIEGKKKEKQEIMNRRVRV